MAQVVSRSPRPETVVQRASSKCVKWRAAHQSAKGTVSCEITREPFPSALTAVRTELLGREPQRLDDAGASLAVGREGQSRLQDLLGIRGAPGGPRRRHRHRGRTRLTLRMRVCHLGRPLRFARRPPPGRPRNSLRSGPPAWPPRCPWSPFHRKRRGNPLPRGSLADLAQDAMGHSTIAAAWIRPVLAGETLGEDLLIDLSVDLEGLHDREGHDGVVGVMPGRSRKHPLLHQRLGQGGGRKKRSPNASPRERPSRLNLARRIRSAWSDGSLTSRSLWRAGRRASLTTGCEACGGPTGATRRRPPPMRGCPG